MDSSLSSSKPPPKELRIGIIAGEASGDILGAALIDAIRQRAPGTLFEGVGGPLMLDTGFHSLFAMEKLSVMGLVEPLKRLPELLRLRKQVIQHFLSDPPDLVIGIDSPDFTLTIEQRLRKKGIKTAHMVSPSVWAWRQGRIKKIKKAVDLMLTLFPFEEAFYHKHQVPVTFIGHPLADKIPLEPNKTAARKALDVAEEETLIALLPGSRGGEVKLMGELFVQTALQCLAQKPELRFIIPAANEDRRKQLELILEPYQEALKKASGVEMPIRLVDGKSQLCMTSADVVMMASGTTTLEAMLLKRPMVVTYKMAPLSYAIISRLVRSPYISLPNLLAGKELVPEILQEEATVANLSKALFKQLAQVKENSPLIKSFTEIHQSLRCDAGDKAAQACLALIKGDDSRVDGSHVDDSKT